MTDIEINRSVKARPIQDLADQLGIQASELLPYGKLKAKVSLDVLERLHSVPLGRYVLVTAINPTPLGEGKTTTSIGLAMAFPPRPSNGRHASAAFVGAGVWNQRRRNRWRAG